MESPRGHVHAVVRQHHPQIHQLLGRPDDDGARQLPRGGQVEEMAEAVASGTGVCERTNGLAEGPGRHDQWTCEPDGVVSLGVDQSGEVYGRERFKEGVHCVNSFCIYAVPETDENPKIQSTQTIAANLLPSNSYSDCSP